MSDTPSTANGNHHAPACDGASVTLRGTVEAISSSFAKYGSDVVQVVIEEAEPLYREIRLRTPFQDAQGSVLTLQANSVVEITIRRVHKNET